MNNLSTWAFRLAVTAVLLLTAWRADTPALAWLYVAPLLGALWAGPLMEGGIALGRALRLHAAGQHGQALHHFHGRPVHLQDDAQGALWLDAESARRLGVALPDDARLAGRFPPEGLRWVDQRMQLRADLLLAQLRHSSQAPSLRVARWLEREFKGHQLRRAAAQQRQ